jgi:hypothetical protein
MVSALQIDAGSFQGLSQLVQHVWRKSREFVKEQHPKMSHSDLSRSGRTSSTYQGGG